MAEFDRTRKYCLCWNLGKNCYASIRVELARKEHRNIFVRSQLDAWIIPWRAAQEDRPTVAWLIKTAKARQLPCRGGYGTPYHYEQTGKRSAVAWISGCNARLRSWAGIQRLLAWTELVGFKQCWKWTPQRVVFEFFQPAEEGFTALREND